MTRILTGDRKYKSVLFVLCEHTTQLTLCISLVHKREEPLLHDVFKPDLLRNHLLQSGELSRTDSIQELWMDAVVSERT